MKLSEKYFQKIEEDSMNSEGNFFKEIKLYGEIKYWEGKLAETQLSSRKIFYEKQLSKLAKVNDI